MKAQSKLSFKKIMEMPVNSKERIQINKVITGVNASIRGYLQRCKFKKLLFLNLVTGKKAIQLKDEDLKKVPSSKIMMVKLKEKNFGRLKLNQD